MLEFGNLAEPLASMKVPTRRWGNNPSSPSSAVNAVASMKVPTRRWGNVSPVWDNIRRGIGLNESPHPKVGKFGLLSRASLHLYCLNESPHPKVGKLPVAAAVPNQNKRGLNESPHPKVGKSGTPRGEKRL